MYKSQLGEYSSHTETYTSVRVFRVHNQLENYLIKKKNRLIRKGFIRTETFKNSLLQKPEIFF